MAKKLVRRRTGANVTRKNFTLTPAGVKALAELKRADAGNRSESAIVEDAIIVYRLSEIARGVVIAAEYSRAADARKEER